MRTFKCQNCGAEGSVSDPCTTQPDNYICDACANRGVTMRLVKMAKALDDSTEPPRIIHVTEQVIH